MKKVFLLGNHSKRTPTAYRPYQSLLSDSFEFDCTLAKSDIVILGHIRDLYNVVRETAAILQSRISFFFPKNLFGMSNPVESSLINSMKFNFMALIFALKYIILQTLTYLSTYIIPIS